MAKSVKKKNLRLRRRIRKTAGALFLISSLLVAAIPVDNFTVEADTAENTLFPSNGVTYTVTREESTVPKVATNETVYTSGDGKYQYAYVYKNGQNAGDKVAVILGYSASQLDNNALIIPDTLDVYKKQTHSQGSGSGYIAVGKAGNDLWYKTAVQDTNPDGSPKFTTEFVLDEEGNPILGPDGVNYLTEEVPVMIEKVYPCYYDTRAQWENIELDYLYTPTCDYSQMTDGINEVKYYKQTTTEDIMRVKSIDVCYIGNQPLITNPDETWSIGEWITPQAVEAGTAAATALGEVIATHVIPRPHADVEKLLPVIK